MAARIVGRPAKMTATFMAAECPKGLLGKRLARHLTEQPPPALRTRHLHA
jgi:hypothetical protein